ncbi:heme-binding protein 2-like [Pseudophryne corroboree]|uniref:heme-binding protein 2-like n=1 Tax=Pseudophryne corroboree TaxID=495146 RepID=UPI003081B951
MTYSFAVCSTEEVKPKPIPSLEYIAAKLITFSCTVQLYTLREAAMASVSLLLLSLLSLYGTAVLAEENSVDGFPSFCGSYQCPKYQVLKNYNTFELRRYDMTRWVTTQLDNDVFGFGIIKSVKRLFNYINGVNKQGVSIKMTVPVRVSVPLNDPTSNATISFFLPLTLVDPPQPNDPSVFLESYPETHYFVRSFSGYALTSNYEKKSKALSEELDYLAINYDVNVGIAAAYNDPLVFFNRHNEVWFRSLNQ